MQEGVLGNRVFRVHFQYPGHTLVDMVFVRDGERLLYFYDVSLLEDYLDNKYHEGSYYIHDGTRILYKPITLHNDQEIRISLRLPGGKGGFGSNLRAQGNRLSARKRSGNYESCRDLATGLRLRDLQRTKLVTEFEQSGGKEGVKRKREREYRERVEKRVAEEESKLRRVDGRDLMAVERAHKEAEKIESITVSSLAQSVQSCDNPKQIRFGWEEESF